MRIATLALIALSLAACATDQQLAANIARGQDPTAARAREGRFMPPNPTPGLSCRMALETRCIP